MAMGKVSKQVGDKGTQSDGLLVQLKAPYELFQLLDTGYFSLREANPSGGLVPV
jgi:hypothetical protein